MHRPSARRSLLTAALFLLVFLPGAAFVLASFNEKTGHTWDWSKIPGAFWTETQVYQDRMGNREAIPAGPGPLLKGLYQTLLVSAASLALGALLGGVVGLASLTREPVLRGLCVGYVEFLRGTPLLVQVYVMYFFVAPAIIDELVAGASAVLGVLFATDTDALLGAVGVERNFLSAVLVMAVFVSAYIAEIVRAGVQSVDRGQTEAARSLGLSHWQCMRHVVLPQALRRMLPPLTGQAMTQVKDSSLVSVISVNELTFAGKNLAQAGYTYFETYFTVALLYLALTLPLTVMTRVLDRRFKRELR